MPINLKPNQSEDQQPDSVSSKTNANLCEKYASFESLESSATKVGDCNKWLPPAKKVRKKIRKPKIARKIRKKMRIKRIKKKFKVLR